MTLYTRRPDSPDPAVYESRSETYTMHYESLHPYNVRHLDYLTHSALACHLNLRVLPVYEGMTVTFRSPQSLCPSSELLRPYGTMRMQTYDASASQRVE